MFRWRPLTGPWISRKAGNSNYLARWFMDRPPMCELMADQPAQAGTKRTRAIMGIMDKGFERQAQKAQDFFGDSEEVRVSMLVFGRHPALLAGGLLGALLGKPRPLVVTDQSVKLLKDSGKVKSNISEELASVPLDTDLGELKGLNGKYTFPNGELAYVSKLYFGRINEARGIA